MELEKVLKDLAYKIFSELGGGFKECIYQNAFAIELRKLGHHIEKEINHGVFYCGEEVGSIRIDMLVDREFIIEFKAINKITDKEINQVRRYLKVFESDGVKLGFIINTNLEKCEVIHVE